MSHIPVNHHLRPLYRALATLIGLYVFGFGALGLVATRGTELFARGDTVVLGLRTNPAFSVLSVLVGAVIVGATLIGRNLDRLVYLACAVSFLFAGTVMMMLIHTDSNLLNFSIGTCVVSYVIGMALLAAGLYAKVGSVGRPAMEAARF
jgi:hypothetical protein